MKLLSLAQQYIYHLARPLDHVLSLYAVEELACQASRLADSLRVAGAPMQEYSAPPFNGPLLDVR